MLDDGFWKWHNAFCSPRYGREHVNFKVHMPVHLRDKGATRTPDIIIRRYEDPSKLRSIHALGY